MQTKASSLTFSAFKGWFACKQMSFYKLSQNPVEGAVGVLVYELLFLLLKGIRVNMQLVFIYSFTVPHAAAE